MKKIGVGILLQASFIVSFSTQASEPKDTVQEISRANSYQKPSHTLPFLKRIEDSLMAPKATPPHSHSMLRPFQLSLESKALCQHPTKKDTAVERAKDQEQARWRAMIIERDKAMGRPDPTFNDGYLAQQIEAASLKARLGLS